MPGLEVWQHLAIVGAGITGLFVICRAALGVYRLAKRVEAVHDAVLTELLPNGGSTLVDRVAALEVNFGNYQDCQEKRWTRLYRRLGMQDS